MRERGVAVKSPIRISAVQDSTCSGGIKVGRRPRRSVSRCLVDRCPRGNGSRCLVGWHRTVSHWGIK